MSSAAQVLANQRNSLHSTGPVSVEGKAVSARNSTRHGLTSKQIVLPGEDPAEYDALRENLLRHNKPENETESTLVDEVAAGSWRLARARRHETAILKTLIREDAIDPDAAFAALFVNRPQEVERLQRYVTTIERSYYRALNKLQALRKERAKQQRESRLVETWISRYRPANPEIGFDSQNAQVLAVQPLPQASRAAMSMPVSASSRR